MKCSHAFRYFINRTTYYISLYCFKYLSTNKLCDQMWIMELFSISTCGLISAQSWNKFGYCLYWIWHFITTTAYITGLLYCTVLLLFLLKNCVIVFIVSADILHLEQMERGHQVRRRNRDCRMTLPWSLSGWRIPASERTWTGCTCTGDRRGKIFFG